MQKLLTVLTDHFQFYVGDADLWQRIDTANFWKDKQGMVEADGLVSIGTVRNRGKTQIELVVDEDHTPSGTDVKKIGDFQLSLPSGQLQIWGPEQTRSQHVISEMLPAGEYVGAAYAVNTGSVLDEMSETGTEKYVVILRRTLSVR